MDYTLRCFVILIGAIFVFVVLRLLIKGRSNTRNSLYWLGGALVILFLSAIPNVLEVLADIMGVDYPPSLLFLFSTLIMLLIILYQSTEISKLNERVKEITQLMAVKDIVKHESIKEEENERLFKSAGNQRDYK